MGVGVCKGFCDPDGAKPITKYFTHNYCRSCGWWVEKGECESKIRCPCCRSLVSQRPRNSKAKAKYREMYSGKNR